MGHVFLSDVPGRCILTVVSLPTLGTLRSSNSTRSQRSVEFPVFSFLISSINIIVNFSNLFVVKFSFFIKVS